MMNCQHEAIPFLVHYFRQIELEHRRPCVAERASIDATKLTKIRTGHGIHGVYRGGFERVYFRE